MIEKLCENCGQRFQCGQYGCWCSQVPLTDWQYDWIADRFKECLCPACLEQVRAGVIGPRAAPVEPRASEEGKAPS